MHFAAMLLPILLAAASSPGVSSSTFEAGKALSSQEIKEKFAVVDGDGDGCVTWAEKEAAHAKNPAMDDDEESFKMLDTDGSDCITLEELATLWKK